MILEIDLGNTRIKWRERSAAGTISATRAMQIDTVDQLEALTFSCPPERVRIATVRGPAIESELVSWSVRRFGITPEFARSSARSAGVTNGYAVPEKLGVDRWLAILAAYRLARSAVVVLDFGSAMTVDAITDEGIHLGGCIGPGLRMMEGSLLRETDLVRFAAGEVGDLAPGTDTRSAVANGVIAAAAGFANELWGALRESTGSRLAYVTGGDAPLVAPYLRFPNVLEPDLVLEGLSLALP